MTRRMHFRIWISFMVILVLSVIVSGAVVNLVFSKPPFAENAQVVADYFVADLVNMDTKSRQERLDAIGKAFASEIGLYGNDKRLIAGTKRPAPLPAWGMGRGTFTHDSRAAAFQTKSGYYITIDSVSRYNHAGRIIFWLSSFVGFLFLGSYFISRRLTRRLELLSRSVASWDFDKPPAPIPSGGSDEVATLAESFNSAAQRIALLLGQQRNLLASVSHELRTPLARIRLASQMMAESGGPEKRRHILASVHEDIAELDGLVDDILLSARLDANPLEEKEMEELDLGLLAAEMAHPHGFAAEGSAKMKGHRKMLRRMIGNLLENAAKHAPGSPVKIETGSGAGAVFIRVTDGGPGLSELERGRIFEPFFRGESAASSEGYGLGLSIVKKIAQRHGGSVQCLAREGGGTVFDFRFPGACR